MVAKLKIKTDFKVKKKGGNIVPLVPEKIYKSLREAASASGLSDIELKAIFSRGMHELENIFLPGETILSIKVEETVLSVLREKGFSPMARIFYSQSQLKQNLRKKIRVHKQSSAKDVDVTDFSLLVTNSRDVVTSAWHREKIEEGLVRETGLKKSQARLIAKEVEKKIEQIKNAGEKIDESKYKRIVAEVVDEFKQDAEVTTSAAKKLGEQLSGDWSMIKSELSK